ncbi:MAG: DNA polymerase Y family protein [Polyangiaceae bacterium]|jgi:protein ImuB|nr:DNA polymerase Y family protein [Polyangiaceae bacterium]
MLSPPRRVAAVVLPRLATELVRARGGEPLGPLAVVLSSASMEESSAAAIVDAVDERAAALGVRPGMRVSEAMARSAEVTFATLAHEELDAALGAVAEVAMSFGAVVEIDAASRDTIWVDVTGVAHLFGGEHSLREAMVERVAALGLCVEVAVSEGPFFAQALARYGRLHPEAPRVVPAGEVRRALGRLPVAALGLGAEGVAFFERLGVRDLAGLARIDRAQLASRLAGLIPPARAASPRDAKEVLGWLDGIDARPLVPYEPPSVLVEQVSFEDGVEAAPQLLFAVRGLASRLSARLTGRRQATNRVEVILGYDRSIFTLRSREARPGEPALSPSRVMGFELPAPLSHTDDIFRAVKAKVEVTELAAPVVRLEIRLSRVVRAPEIQLDLSRDVSVSPDALPALLSELSAELGEGCVGVLSSVDDHRPERRTALIGVHEAAADRRRRAQGSLFEPAPLSASEPARLLPEPAWVGSALEGERRVPALHPGQIVLVGGEGYVVQRVEFDRRLTGVGWWTDGVASRDYLRVTLSSSHTSSAEAWVYADRRTGEVFLQGWWE